ncbi:MAG: hypothetical protein R3A48_25015 [Polyangiales bacterium]
MRFEMNATDPESVVGYFRARAVQGLAEGLSWSGRVEPLREAGVTWGARTSFTDRAGVAYESVYVLAQHRGEGRLSRHVETSPGPFLTAPSCELERFFKRRGVPHRVVGHFERAREYEAIAAHYGDRAARRSGVALMNHIDEGLAVLADLGAHDEVWRAWCLHPLFQLDEALPESFSDLARRSESARVLVLAMEYRNTANACLARHEPASPEAIARSPLPEVNAMLVADKVQNAKDFILYHRGTHPRTESLERYFHHWLARLGVSRGEFARYFEALQAEGPRRPLPEDW